MITLPDGREIAVVFTGLDRGKARIGFIADHDIVIDRRVIYETKRAEVASCER